MKARLQDCGGNALRFTQVKALTVLGNNLVRSQNVMVSVRNSDTVLGRGSPQKYWAEEA